MKNAGDRSKAYARAINELAKAETGLREWSIASSGYLLTAVMPSDGSH